jgi:hypothetical protein
MMHRDLQEVMQPTWQHTSGALNQGARAHLFYFRSTSNRNGQ